MTAPYLRRFAARGVFWRQYLDWALLNVPFYLQPILLFLMTILFFVFGPVTRETVHNLAFVLPGSSRIANYLRAFRVLHNYAWTITEATHYKLTKDDYAYEIVGAEYLEQLGQAKGAIVLTAHMGNYDLGAALFARKFDREIKMVRAPEPDELSGRHLDESLAQTGAGAVKVAYNRGGAMLSFDLLNALRAGEIVSIQGDRTMEGAANVEGRLFGQPALLPSGPFTLALVAQAPIFPLFIVRAGYRSYKIVVSEPIALARAEHSREAAITAGAAAWCAVLEGMISQHWDQWFAFGPIFAADANS